MALTAASFACRPGGNFVVAICLVRSFTPPTPPIAVLLPGPPVPATGPPVAPAPGPPLAKRGGGPPRLCDGPPVA